MGDGGAGHVSYLGRDKLVSPVSSESMPAVYISVRQLEQRTILSLAIQEIKKKLHCPLRPKYR